MQLIYSLLYSHQSLCLLFISALLMFIFMAISDTSVSVLFQSVSKVKFSPRKPSFFPQNISNTHSSSLLSVIFILLLSTLAHTHEQEVMHVHTKKF